MPDLKPTLLVVGARSGSLGQDVVDYAREYGDYRNVSSAGFSGQEEHYLNILNIEKIREVLGEVRPDHVVCTVGINDPRSFFDGSLAEQMQHAFLYNVTGPMQLLREFSLQTDTKFTHPKFVAISSNSARIARTKSMPYCASKAALSMAIRCAARELARGNAGTLAWGYEPGLLDTVMTREMFPEINEPLHRMEGVRIEGIRSQLLAERIVTDLAMKGNALNGCMIPFDAGEQ